MKLCTPSEAAALADDTGFYAQLHPCRIFGDGDDWGGGDRPEGSDDDDDEEDHENEHLASD